MGLTFISCATDSGSYDDEDFISQNDTPPTINPDPVQITDNTIIATWENTEAIYNFNSDGTFSKKILGGSNNNLNGTYKMFAPNTLKLFYSDSMTEEYTYSISVNILTLNNRGRIYNYTKKEIQSPPPVPKDSERILGTWKRPDNQTITFDNNGIWTVTRNSRGYYTVMEESKKIQMKFLDGKNYDYDYSFTDKGNLIIDGKVHTRIE